MDCWPELRITRARFHLQVEYVNQFMVFPEAVMRGALGYFWHDAGSRFQELYDLVFGASRKGVQDRIATPPSGAALRCVSQGEESVDLEFTLFGNREAQVPLLLESLHILGYEGVGDGRCRFYVEGFPDYETKALDEWVLAEPIGGEPLPLSFEPSHGVCIDVVSPMTLRAIRGKFLMDWDTESFFRNLLQRVRQLAEFYGTPLPQEWGADLSEDLQRLRASSDTRTIERSRRSSRQNSNLDYSGFLGCVILRNVSARLFDLLRMGSIVGAGKNTVMGSGRYSLTLL